MTAPVEVLAALDHIISVEKQWGDHQLSQMATEARAAVAELYAERDRLANIVRDHEAQILRMTGAQAGLVRAADKLQEKAIGHTKLTSTVFTKHIESLRAALARCKGGAA